MSEGFKGEVPRPVDKNENNKFTGKYDKESVLGRFATIQGTTMGEIVDQALNHVNLDVSMLENLEYTEEQAQAIASLMGSIHLELDGGNVDVANSIATKLAELIDSI